MLKLPSEEKFSERDLIFINSMSQYTINPDGSRTIYSRYTQKGVCTLMEIFPKNTDTSKKFIKRKRGYEKVSLQTIYKVHDNSYLVRKIFSRFIFKILTRIALGDIFEMSPRTKAHLVVKSMPDEVVKKVRQKGYYSDYDIVRAGFKIPEFIYDFGPYSRRRDVKISVPVALKKETLKRAENRQIQWSYIPKTFDRDVQDD